MNIKVNLLICSNQKSGRLINLLLLKDEIIVQNVVLYIMIWKNVLNSLRGTFPLVVQIYTAVLEGNYISLYSAYSIQLCPFKHCIVYTPYVHVCNMLYKNKTKQTETPK